MWTFYSDFLLLATTSSTSRKGRDWDSISWSPETEAALPPQCSTSNMHLYSVAVNIRRLRNVNDAARERQV